MKGGDRERRVWVELTEEEYEMLKKLRKRIEKERRMKLWKSILLAALLRSNARKRV